MSGGSGTSARPGEFAHPALFYRGDEEYLAGVGGFVRTAVECGEPVLVALPGSRLGALRGYLGADGRRAEFVDITVLGRNPGRILAALQEFADASAGRAARIVGEPLWPGRSEPEVLEGIRHEALINTAFTGRHATVLCLYDVKRLPGKAVADARRTHPTLVEDGRQSVSPQYADPRVVCADCDLPLPEPAHAVTVDYTGGQLGLIRDHTEAWARRTALDRVRRSDLVLAVSEAAANSVAYGGGSGTLRLWSDDAGGVVAEIRDAGRLADPLAGRRRPSLESANGGRGLWLIHRVSDLVEVRAGEAGLTLRLHFAAH